MKENYLKWGRK